MFFVVVSKGEKHSGRHTNSKLHRYTMMLGGSMAGEKSKLFLLFREFTQPEWDRTVDQLGEEMTELVYENKSATFDKETYLQWLELVKDFFSVKNFYGV